MSESQLLLKYSLSLSLRRFAGLLLTISMSKQAMFAINASVFELVNYDTREDAENQATVCHILLSIVKEF